MEAELSVGNQEREPEMLVESSVKVSAPECDSGEDTKFHAWDSLGKGIIKSPCLIINNFLRIIKIIFRPSAKAGPQNGQRIGALSLRRKALTFGFY